MLVMAIACPLFNMTRVAAITHEQVCHNEKQAIALLYKIIQADPQIKLEEAVDKLIALLEHNARFQKIRNAFMTLRSKGLFKPQPSTVIREKNAWIIGNELSKHKNDLPNDIRVLLESLGSLKLRAILVGHLQ